MLDFLSLIFLNIYPYLFYVTDSLPSDTTTVSTDLTSLKTDSLSFPKEVLLDVPIIPPFDDPPLLLGINVLLCGHPS